MADHGTGPAPNNRPDLSERRAATGSGSDNSGPGGAASDDSAQWRVALAAGLPATLLATAVGGALVLAAVTSPLAVVVVVLVVQAAFTVTALPERHAVVAVLAGSVVATALTWRSGSPGGGTPGLGGFETVSPALSGPAPGLALAVLLLLALQVLLGSADGTVDVLARGAGAALAAVLLASWVAQAQTYAGGRVTVLLVAGVLGAAWLVLLAEVLHVRASLLVPLLAASGLPVAVSVALPDRPLGLAGALGLTVGVLFVAGRECAAAWEPDPHRRVVWDVVLPLAFVGPVTFVLTQVTGA